jgi:hypothetical protein
MLFAILNAGILYSPLWVYEKKRSELDDFDVSRAAAYSAGVRDQRWGKYHAYL